MRGQQASCNNNLHYFAMWLLQYTIVAIQDEFLLYMQYRYFTHGPDSYIRTSMSNMPVCHGYHNTPGAYTIMCQWGLVFACLSFHRSCNNVKDEIHHISQLGIQCTGGLQSVFIPTLFSVIRAPFLIWQSVTLTTQIQQAWNTQQHVFTCLPHTVGKVHVILTWLCS